VQSRPGSECLVLVDWLHACSNPQHVRCASHKVGAAAKSATPRADTGSDKQQEVRDETDRRQLALRLMVAERLFQEVSQHRNSD